MVEKAPSAPRFVAIVDPDLSSKTLLLETVWLTCGAIHGQGTGKDGNPVDDATLEARARHMSIKFSIWNGEFWVKDGHFWIVLGRLNFVRNPELH